jgi:hypothetical protein
MDEVEQLAMWAARADEAYLMSGSNADVRSMCAALAAGLRTLELGFRHREELQTNEAQDLSLEPKQWSEPDRIRMMAFLDHIILATPTPEVGITRIPTGGNNAKLLLPLRLK